jgi:hypothetical protein
VPFLHFAAALSVHVLSIAGELEGHGRSEGSGVSSLINSMTIRHLPFLLEAPALSPSSYLFHLSQIPFPKHLSRQKFETIVGIAVEMRVCLAVAGDGDGCHPAVRFHRRSQYLSGLSLFSSFSAPTGDGTSLNINAVSRCPSIGTTCPV